MTFKIMLWKFCRENGIIIACGVMNSLTGSYSRTKDNKRVAMSKKIKIKGRFRTYKITLYILGVILALITIGIYFLDYRAGIILNIFLLFYFAGLLFANIRSKQFIINELISFATEYGQVQRQILRELQLPHALLDQSGKVIWTNIEFEKMVG